MDTQLKEVHKAIHAVQAGLAKKGIGKDRNNAAQGYKFRGIDDVYDAMTPLLVEHNLIVMPCAVLDHSSRELPTKAGGTMIYTVVKMQYKFISCIDGSVELAEVCGEGMDSGDKSTNKAQSAAYKYMAIMSFGIPTAGVSVDNENDNPQIGTRREPRQPAQPRDPQQSTRPIAGKTNARTADDPVHPEDLDLRESIDQEAQKHGFAPGGIWKCPAIKGRLLADVLGMVQSGRIKGAGAK